jgi:hypothetical protein
MTDECDLIDWLNREIFNAIIDFLLFLFLLLLIISIMK